MSNDKWIHYFVDGVIHEAEWTEYDRNYLVNRVIALIGMNEIAADDYSRSTPPPALVTCKNHLVEMAVSNGAIADSLSARDQLGATLMDLITPSPTKINQTFHQYAETDAQKATDYFYQLSCQNDYIKTEAIAKNIRFFSKQKYGTYEITINLSKPEKDPKEIALARTMKTSKYPRTMLAPENEGYQGRVDYPSRVNHRIIWFPMGAETWGFQYSPYAYYQEHCIFLNQQVVPMKITQQTFERLLGIIDRFPHYFVGSNADLPIVGGSILSHDHYQGGLDVFPMSQATVDWLQADTVFDSVQLGIVNWPMSVIRLSSSSKEELVACATSVLAYWDEYSDLSQDIVAHAEDGTRHHTITPIARQRDGVYELDLVLRDNHTTATYPDGLFHPHPQYHHIKKENIGLIEVMGLAILPPRLKDELAEVKKTLIGENSQVVSAHQDWVEDLKAQVDGPLSEEQADALIEQSLGEIFEQILENAGVFKRTEAGQNAFRAFVSRWQADRKGA
ncbi:UDP-glucose--hexose-1-phosphate uridylyltransferase [Enterococcus italicus]